MRRFLYALTLLASCSSRLAFAQPTRPFDDSVRAALMRILARVDTVHDTTIVTRVRVDTLLVPAPIPAPPPAPTPAPSTRGDSDAVLHVARFVRTQPVRAVADSEPDWLRSNYYDRAHIYYAAAVTLGDTTLKARAAAIAVDYRTRYLEANAYNIQPHQYQGLGLLEHYRATGDTMSRHAITGVAEKYRTIWLGTHYMSAAGSDPRIGARILESFLESWTVDTAGSAPAKWSKALDSALVRIAAWQDSTDGAFHSSLFCGGVPNYMNGLMGAILGRVYDDYRADPAILASVLRIGTYLWSTQWRPADLSFNYVSVDCPGIGSVTVSPDLNGLYLEMFGWLWRRTGDRVWRDRGDSLLAGSLRGKNINSGIGAYLGVGKLWNQSYQQTFGPRGYLALR